MNNKDTSIKKQIQKNMGLEKDNRVIFHTLNIRCLNIPSHLLTTYEQYVTVLWETNVYFGFEDLTEKEKTMLEKMEFEIMFLQEKELVPYLMFIIDKDYFTKDLKKTVIEKGGMDFAKRIVNCMYSDLGILPSDE